MGTTETKRDKNMTNATSYWYNGTPYNEAQARYCETDEQKKVDNYHRCRQTVTGNVAVHRIHSSDHWMAYDITEGHMNAVYVGMIPGVFANVATATIIAD